jgi:hypothetical protein
MLNQYHAQRRQGGHNPHGKGTIPVGAILYLQDGMRPMGGFRTTPVCRNPWQVIAWLPRESFTGPAAGGHLALVKSLRDGRTQTVADWILLACDDAGLAVA